VSEHFDFFTVYYPVAFEGKATNECWSRLFMSQSGVRIVLAGIARSGPAR